jgi:hypothetical protein
LDAFGLSPKTVDKPPIPVAAVSAPVPVIPPPPSFDYKFMGRLSGINGNNIFLADAKDGLIQAKVGQKLAGGWVLSTVEDKKLVFRHGDSGQEKIIAIGTLQ